MIYNNETELNIKRAVEQEGFENESIQILPHSCFTHIDTIARSMDGAMAGVVRTGSLRMTINGEQHRLVANNIFVIHEGVKVEHIRPSKQCTGYLVIFHGKYMMSMDVDTKDFVLSDLNARMSPIFDIDKGAANSIYDTVVSLIETARSKKIYFTQGVITSLTNALFYLILSLLRPADDFVSAKRKSNIYMVRFVELLSQYHRQERSVEFYAQKLGITPKYLTMVCRKFRGITASQMIDTVVIHSAMRLLKEPGVSMQQVADELNFPSQSFFGKYFKQRVGVSPSRYKGQGN